MPLTDTDVELEFSNVQADTPFVVGIPVYNAPEIYVYYGLQRILAVQGYDYTVELNEDTYENFTITFTPTFIDTTLVSSGETNIVHVRRQLPLTTDFDEASALRREQIVYETIRMLMRLQQVAYDASRAIDAADDLVTAVGAATTQANLAAVAQAGAETAQAAAEAAQAAAEAAQSTATGQAVAAAASAAAAAGSATAAAGSATAAAGSASAANTSATNAANSASAAAGSATAASTSATNAANSASAAAGSATSAATQATNAANSATAAANSATAANTSATNAANSASAAAASAASISMASAAEVLQGTLAIKLVTPDTLAALWEKGANVAAAATLTLGEGGYFNITGNTGITDIDWAVPKDGRTAILYFTGTPRITHSAALSIVGGASWQVAAGDMAIVVQDNGDNVRLIPILTSGKLVATSPLKRQGCVTSNSGSHGITIAPGVYTDDTGSIDIALTGAITKLSNVAWAVGSGNGGLDTGAAGNNTYHVWLIYRDDTGVVDALISLSPTAPVMPAGYTHKAYLAPIVRASGVVRPYIQDTFYPDRFMWSTPIADHSTTTPFPGGLINFSVPVGIVTYPIIMHFLTTAAGANNGAHQLADLGPAIRVCQSANGSEGCDLTDGDFRATTNGQIYFQRLVFFGSLAASTLTTCGFYHRLGRTP